MRDALDCDGINLLQLLRAGRVADRLPPALHVIPRYDGDPLRLPGQPSEPEEGELADVAAAAAWLATPASSATGTSASSCSTTRR